MIILVADGGRLYKIYNIIPDISQQSPTINEYIVAKNFRFDNYPAILIFNLLLYVVKVIVQLDKYYNFF